MSTVTENIVPSSQILEKIRKFAKAHWKGAILILLLLAAAFVGSKWYQTKGEAAAYSTGKASTGSVQVEVSATGTVQAVTTVQVGTQVSGTVSWLGADFKSVVKKGQVIAKLDPALFQAQVEIAKANLANAQASVKAAGTDVTNQGANVDASVANEMANQAARDDAVALAKQNEELRGVIPDRDIQSSQAAARVAVARSNQATAQIGQSKASVQGSKAKVQQAQASVQLAQAQLDQANVNLEHATIESPIDGVVVSRSVDVGQTVSASLSAPTLFTIANDLTSMQVLASVDEADVGQVKEGGDARFAVDAFPGTSFSGKVKQVRLNAQAAQNVVTYTAVIDVSNPELKLLPGMTANITFTVERHDNVLTVPNAALRFKPASTAKESPSAGTGQQSSGNRQQRSGSGQGANAASNKDGAATDAHVPKQTVWVLTATNTLEPRRIEIGLTDGRVTEVKSGDLKEGETVVTGENDPNAAAPAKAAQNSSPFGSSRPAGAGAGGGRGTR